MAPSDFAMADLHSVLQSIDTALIGAVLFFCLGLLLVLSVATLTYLGARIHQWLSSVQTESAHLPAAARTPTDARSGRRFNRAGRLSEKLT